MLNGILSILSILSIVKLGVSLVPRQARLHGGEAPVEGLPMADAVWLEFQKPETPPEPVYRFRSSDGTLGRKSHSDLMMDFDDPEIFEVRSIVVAQDMWSSSEIQDYARRRLDYLLRQPLWNENGITLDLLCDYDKIYRRVADCITDSTGTLKLYPGIEHMVALTRNGLFVEVTEEEISVWEKVDRFFRVNDRNPTSAPFIPYLCNHVNEILQGEELRVFVETQFRNLSVSLLNDILYRAKKTYVSLEDEWIPVNSEFFSFMSKRFSLLKNHRNRSQPHAAQVEPIGSSLARFFAPQGFHPLKVDGDGLFLVTPRMEQMEDRRPVFKFTYLHTRGYCYNGATMFGAKCNDDIAQRPRYSIRGLAGYAKECDVTKKPSPDIKLLPDALMRKYMNGNVSDLTEKLRPYATRLLHNDTLELAVQFLIQGRYLQMFSEVRDYDKWLRRTLIVASDLNFDEEMSGWREGVEDEHGLYETSKDDLERYIWGRRYGRPILSCRPRYSAVSLPTSDQHDSILQGITICLDRAYGTTNCQRRGTCGDRFLIAKSFTGPYPPWIRA